jgi:hypothetical protein
MNVTIQRHDGDHHTHITLDAASADQIDKLGWYAQEMLSRQDQARWAKVSGSDFLPRLVAGAVILRRLGRHRYTPFRLDDDGAHLAFMACCAVAIAAKTLDSDMRDFLKRTLKLIAQCCPTEMTIPPLPPLETLPKRYQSNEVIRRQYKLWSNTTPVTGDVMLSDAPALLWIFQKANRPGDAKVLHELVEATEGLLTALRRIGAKP